VRVLVLALLLANLLYFGWAEWIDVPPPPQPSSIARLPRLRLVSELPPAERQALAQKMAQQAAPPLCVSVGPFDDPDITAKALALLQAKSFSPRQRLAQVPAVRRLWVHLDGLKSDASVTRVLHTLEHGGIDDAEAMPAQAGLRQISLGLFSDPARAAGRMKAVRALGLKPRLDPRTVPGTVYWLDLTLANGSVSVPLKDVSSLEPSTAQTPISVQPCPTGAAPTAAPPTTVPAKPPAPPPQTASQAAPPLPAGLLPRCKPGGKGPVPCVASETRDAAHPSVL
jgi:hypothetical protein